MIKSNLKELNDLLQDTFVVKQNDNFIMYGYKLREEANENEKKLNNVICDKNKKILHYCGEFINEVKNEEVGNFEEAYAFPEGTVLRLFYYNNEWVLSTTRCLDAGNSYFSNKISFKQLFEEVIDKDFYNNLDKSKAYCYILKHKSNRIIMEVDKNEVILLSTITINDDDFCMELNKNFLISEEEKNKGIDFLTEKYKQITIVSKNIINKVLSEKYIRMRQLKKINNNNPILRMIDLITKEPENIEEYLSYFPEHNQFYDFILKSLEVFCKKVHRDYISLKIKKQELYFHKMYYNLIYNIHGEYINNRVPVDIETVKRCVYKTDSNNLRYMMFSIFKNCKPTE